MLARLPESINLGEVVICTEPNMWRAECFRPDGQSCTIETNCRLKSILSRAQCSFMTELRRYHLSDLVATDTSPQVLTMGSHYNFC